MFISKTLILLILILSPIIVTCQIEPDSLIGTYAGLKWFKWEEDTNWTINNDTVYITDINGTNCRVIVLSDDPWLGGTWITFETQYSFCYGASTNLFHRFHPEDSLTIIFDDVSPPPPNYHPSSTRFYGYKISDSILVKVNEPIMYSYNTVVYPNPFSEKLKIEGLFNAPCRISIFNMAGDRVFYEVEHFNTSMEIDTKTFPAGAYILQIITKKNTIIKKILKF